MSASLYLPACLVVLLLASACTERAASRPAATGPICVVSGRVVAAQGGAPVADAKVLLAVPGVDWRKTNQHPQHVYESRTDDHGRYVIQDVPVEGGAGVTATLNVQAKGFQTPWGLESWYRAKPELALHMGAVHVPDQALPPGRYVAGTLVDEVGRPVAGVVVTSLAGLAGTSDAGGGFKVFAGPEWPLEISFNHPGFLLNRLDVLAIPVAERARCHVVLTRTYRLAGQVLGLDGRPVPEVFVHAVEQEQHDDLGRREAHSDHVRLTDDHGRFEILGLESGRYKVVVESGNTVARAEVDARHSMDMKLWMVPKSLETVAAVKVLGTTLAEANDVIADTWKVKCPSVVCLGISGIGIVAKRIGTSELPPGTQICSIGGADEVATATVLAELAPPNAAKPIAVAGIEDFLTALLAEAATQQPGPDHLIRIRITVGIPSSEGPKTGPLSLWLRPSDLAEVEAALALLKHK